MVELVWPSSCDRKKEANGTSTTMPCVVKLLMLLLIEWVGGWKNLINGFAKHSAHEVEERQVVVLQVRGGGGIELLFRRHLQIDAPASLRTKRPPLDSP